MVCPTCSRQGPDDASYCPYCGRPYRPTPPPPQWHSPTPAPPPPQPRSSSTVIVLIVVGVAMLFLAFAAVGILGAILFPAFARAHEKAVQVTCQSNLKQLALANLMYVQDWDEMYPLEKRWCDSTVPYANSQDIYRCPGLKGQRCGYAFNANLDKLRLWDTTLPQETCLLFDARGGWNLSGDVKLVVPRHNKGANFAFVAGHVKWRSSQDMGSIVWEPFNRTGRRMDDTSGGDAVLQTPPFE